MTHKQQMRILHWIMKNTHPYHPRPSLKALSAIITVCLSPLTATASTILILDDFESYTLVAGKFDINGKRPNDGNSNNWVKAGGGAADLSTNVIPGSSTGGTPPNEQVLHLLDEEGTFGWFGRRTQLVSHTDTDNRVVFDQKLRVSQTDDSEFFTGMVGQWSPSAVGNYIVRLKISAENGSIEYRHGTTGAGSNPANSTIPGFNLDPANWYSFQITADLAAQTYSLNIINLDNSMDAVLLENLYFGENFTTFEGIGFTPGTNASKRMLDILVDDVQVTAIPESHVIILPAALIFIASILRGSLRRPRK